MAQSEEERFKWRHAVICGLLWGFVVLLAISLSQPVGDLQLGDLVIFVTSLAIIWISTGLVWTVGVKLAEDLHRVGALLPIILLAAWIVSMAATLTPLTAGRAPGDFGHISRVPFFDLGIYTLWVNLFYGGLYTIGYFSTRRTLRLRRRLAELRLARSEAEARLREARLQAVRGQIQPAMLLDALGALGRAYARDQASGDTIFDLLIAFLRAAMPGLRSGASTLSTELSVVGRYAALRDALEPGPPPWRLNLAEPPPDLAFPPLRLLPALDRLSRAAPAAVTVEVTAEATNGGFLLRVGAPAAQPLPGVLMQRLRAAMRRDLGVAAMMHGELTGATVAELRITPPEGAAARPA